MVTYTRSFQMFLNYTHFCFEKKNIFHVRQMQNILIWYTLDLNTLDIKLHVIILIFKFIRKTINSLKILLKECLLHNYNNLTSMSCDNIDFLSSFTAFCKERRIFHNSKIIIIIMQQSTTTYNSVLAFKSGYEVQKYA